MSHKHLTTSQLKRYIDIFTNHHPFVLPVIVFLLLFFLSIASFIGLNARQEAPSDSHIIMLFVDGETRPVPSRAKTVQDFLSRADIQLHPNDRVEPEMDTLIDTDKFHVNIYRARPVTIIENGKKIFALSAGATPRSVVRQAGVKVYPEDKIESEMPTELLRDGMGMKVTIDHATPVIINLYGSKLDIRTHTHSVGELLKEKKIKLKEGDSIKPKLDAPIEPGMQVFVYRSGTEVKSVEEEIPIPIEIIEDSSLSVGSRAIRQAGTPGKRVVTYEITLLNGKEVGRRKIQEVIAIPPVKQIIARGPQGSFDQALARLRQCEAGGNYNINTGNGYYGAYQFDRSTWNGYGGYTLPSDAPPAIQDQKAIETYKRRGWQPWPGCTAKLGLQDIYR